MWPNVCQFSRTLEKKILNVKPVLKQSFKKGIDDRLFEKNSKVCEECNEIEIADI